MTIYLNGKAIDVEENDELNVEATKPAETAKEEVEVLEAKETLGSKIRRLPTWQKIAAGAAAIAGGLWLKGQFSSDEDDEDEEEDDETEDEEE